MTAGLFGCCAKPTLTWT